MSPARETAAVYARERRSSRRYPVGLELRYKLSRGPAIFEEGLGRTRDFSESGVFFHTCQPAGSLPAGLDVELLLDWPGPMSGEAPVRVTILGRTVRVDEAGIGVRILRCDIRASRDSRSPGA